MPEYTAKSHEKHIVKPIHTAEVSVPGSNMPMLSRLSSIGSLLPVPGKNLSHPTAAAHQAAMFRTLQRRQGNTFVQRAIAQSRSTTDIPDAAVEQARSDQSPGQPLDSRVQADMEARFGYDFSDMHIHTDGRAADLAHGIHAQAFTRGQDIYFGAGRYQPNTMQGRRLLAHELTHVVQQGTAGKTQVTLGEDNDIFESEAERVASDIVKSDLTEHITEGNRSNLKIRDGIITAPLGRIQRQLITPLGQGGGFQGLMERDRETAMKPPDATRPPASGNTISIPEAIQGGWRKVRDLDEAILRTANVAQRLVMLAELIQAYWTGGKEEEAIIRILSTTPLSQAPELVKQLSEQTINGKSYLNELDRVVDFGNNLELHNVLSQLRLKAMGPEKGTKALETAPILPWHDVMGFFEDSAVFFISSAPGGKVRAKYPARLFGSTDFADELEKLPTDIFTSGHDYEPDQVLVIHDYDKGRFVPVVAQELIGYQHAGVRGFLSHVATVVSLAAPMGAAKTALGKAAVFVLERLLPAIFLLVDENRLNLVKWFPKWGPKMIYYSDLAQMGVGLYGIGRFAVAGWKIFKSWKEIRQARAALEGVGANAEAERVAVALEKQADEIFAEADKISSSEGKTAQAAETVSEAKIGEPKPTSGEKPAQITWEVAERPPQQKGEPAPHPEAAELSPGTRRAIEDIEHAVCGFCFPAGTKLLAKGGYKNIEDIEVGDFVLARDELLRGDTAYRRVVKTFRNTTDSLIEITVGHQAIKTTPGHVWWTIGKGWTFAQDLGIGDLVVASNDDILQITEVRYISEITVTYNCEVEEYHTYFVAASDEEPGIWVHNASALRVLRPDQVFQLIIPNIFISDRDAIRRVIGRSLNAAGSYSNELSGFFAYLRRGGGAGFQGVTKDAVDRLEVVLQNVSEKGGGVVAAIDLQEIGAQRIFDLSDPELFQRLLNRYPRFEAMFTELASEGVVAVRGKIPARAVQSLVNIPEGLSEVEKRSILEALLRPCR